jgi:MFS family permease
LARRSAARTISWIISAYFLTATATTPLYGKVADIYGRRPTLFTAIGIFVAGSVICALATTMPMLILGRAVQGLGGGGLIALAQTVIGDLVPPKERGKYAVYISGTWAIASLAGPILGGILTQYWHWSMIFWINIPLAGIAVMMTNETLKRVPWAKRDHRLDWAGAGLTILATGSFLLALALAPQPAHGWTSPLVLALLAAAVLLTAWLAWHLSRSSSPLVPLDVGCRSTYRCSCSWCWGSIPLRLAWRWSAT